MTKMTYAQAIDYVLGMVDNDEVAEKLEALKVQLAKRNSGSKGMTKTQKANEELKVRIANDLAFIGSPVTVTDLIKHGEGLEEFSNQKISALLRQMVEAGTVVKTIEKKKAYFTIATV